MLQVKERAMQEKMFVILFTCASRADRVHTYKIMPKFMFFKGTKLQAKPSQKSQV